MLNFFKSKFSKSDGNPETTTPLKQRIILRFKKIKWREQIYLIVSVFLILLLMLVFYRAVSFIGSSILKSFEIDQSAVQSQVVRFNLEDYEKVLPYLIKK